MHFLVLGFLYESKFSSETSHLFIYFLECFNQYYSKVCQITLVSKSSKLFLFIWSWFLANLIFWMSGIMYEKLWRFWGILSCSIKDLTFWGRAGEVRQITFSWRRTDIYCWGCEYSCTFSEERWLVNVKFKISLDVTIFIWKISPRNGKKIISIDSVTHPLPPWRYLRNADINRTTTYTC